MSNNKLKIIFFGTPEFSVPSLEALLSCDFCEIIKAITQPDKPKGRHMSKLEMCPVKKFAKEKGLETSEKMENEKADIGVVVAYGKIIPKKTIDSFRFGIVNLHPSLLPKYRGSSPIQNAILKRDKKTGVTIMLLDEKMDHGPILSQEEYALKNTETAGELSNVLAEKGAFLLVKTIKDYVEGKIKPKEQNHEKATYTEKLTKQNAKIDFSKNPKDTEAFIRAMNPWPGAWTNLEDKKFIIWKASLCRENIDASSKEKIRDHIVCGITLEEVQLEGKKRMQYKEFLKGRKENPIF